MDIRIIRPVCCVWVLLLALFFNKSIGQSHGLVFASHGVVSDYRTSLSLTDKGNLCFRDNFDLSFDLSFQPGQQEYFGYIFRLIKDDRFNIDLVYEFKPVGSSFKIVIGDHVSSIMFTIDSNRLFRSWTTVRLRFDKRNNQLMLTEGDNTYTEKSVDLSGLTCFKAIFGVNHDKKYKALDVPPMKIRNVRIAQDEKLRYHWPLDEEEGNVAHETVNGYHAVVENPLWVRKEHNAWKQVGKFSVSGPASTAFDAQRGLLYVVASDSLYTFSLPQNRQSVRPYHSSPQNLLPGNQSLFTSGNKLYNLYTDQKLVSTFNFTDGKWDRSYTEGPITDFWHVNKFFSPLDSSLYVIGGYGHFKYKNQVQRCHLPSGRWEEVAVTGDRLTPRYLAALGTNKTGDTAWLIGGYGSATGEQIVNPQNLYDLVLFDVKNRSFKKIYDLEAGREGFAFANSLIINSTDNSFYGLIYPNDKYNSELQLIQGSLTSPAITRLGETIPYRFHDIQSFSDLFFYPAASQFVAVTVIHQESQSVISIFTLADPPMQAGMPTADKKDMSYLWAVAGILFLAGVSYVLWRKKFRSAKRKVQFLSKTGEESERVQHQETVPETHEVESRVHAIEEQPIIGVSSSGLWAGDRMDSEHPPRNTISLFGDMQLYDQKGEDITRYFSPLLKELFLLILLHTIRKGTGISSEKLNEILWHDKDEKSARNNRSVNIAKLKNILDRMCGCQVQKTAGYWKMEIDYSSVDLDYVSYLSIVKDRDSLSKQKIKALSVITQRGSFLSNTEYEWLDTYKAEISNDVIDTYLRFAGSLSISEDAEFLTQLANYIFYFDPVNEEAMVIKCKALAHLGKHSLAKHAFESFVREYELIYGEKFDKDLAEVLSTSNHINTFPAH